MYSGKVVCVYVTLKACCLYALPWVVMNLHFYPSSPSVSGQMWEDTIVQRRQDPHQPVSSLKGPGGNNLHVYYVLKSQGLGAPWNGFCVRAFRSQS